jgi:hypothetical protein
MYLKMNDELKTYPVDSFKYKELKPKMQNMEKNIEKLKKELEQKQEKLEVSKT